MSSAVNREAGEKKLLEAQQFEAAGDTDKAVVCYRAAFRLCPELDQELRSSDNDPEEESLMTITRMPNTRGSAAPFRTFQAGDLDSLEKAFEMKKYFEEEGYVVIDGCMSPEEVATAEGHFANFMSCVGIDIKDQEELSARFADPSVGIVGKSGAGHSALNWFVRSRAKVQQGFALTLLEEKEYEERLAVSAAIAAGRTGGAAVTAAAAAAAAVTAIAVTHDAGGSPREEAAAAAVPHKLIVSFDGFNYFRNPETDPSWASSTESWLHFDAGHKDHQRYIQGVVNLIDCTHPSDAGLVVFPRSHKTCFAVAVPQEPEYPGFMTYMGPGEWMKVKKQAVKVAERPFRVPLKAGSLVMWRSSVMHCNSGCLPRGNSKEEDPAFNPEQYIRRLAVYVCMAKDPQDPSLTKCRKRYFNEGRTTAHQPDVLRGSGDKARADFVAKGALIIDEAKLPHGAACLL